MRDQGKGWPLSLSSTSLTLLMNHLELSELHNGTTFNQNHRQSREKLCFLTNTHWSGALRMSDLHTHKWLLSCWRIPLLLNPALDDRREQEQTATDRTVMKQVAIYVLHWKSYWYNDYSLLYVRGASDKLSDWLVNCSVSWPNRKPAVPFCYWFLLPDVPPWEAELIPPPLSQEHTGLAGLHLRGGNWRV